ncbi:MAG TPA: TIGR01777 family oxidoreductase [Polyangiaceae bacterium]|nr:TIGR01777 family oxidoreductase [Polyangiaceae bacterium]
MTGATGLVGRELASRLPAPHVLTRSPEGYRSQSGAKVWGWQPEHERIPAAAFDEVEAVFHLAGEPVAEGRWTAAKKQRIRESRVLGTRQLVASIGGILPRPRVLICASAIGYYGDRGDDVLDETSPGGSGFLAEVCRDWETEALEAEKFGVRVVLARIGLVLAPRGGALERMRTPFRLGLGGKLGSGLQWMSWIQLEDVVGLLLHAAARKQLRGPLNVVSPNPVTNQEFTRQLARALSRPAVLPVPRLALSLALGEISDVLLESQRVLPRVAQQSGYAFAYPELAPALLACTGRARAAG